MQIVSDQDSKDHNIRNLATWIIDKIIVNVFYIKEHASSIYRWSYLLESTGSFS